VPDQTDGTIASSPPLRCSMRLADGFVDARWDTTEGVSRQGETAKIPAPSSQNAKGKM